MRDLDILVLSDIHLGTYGCHAAELKKYLETVNPKMIILNGDIIDGWQFKKKYFPIEHFQIIECLLHKIGRGVDIIYLTGNHDDFLRKITDLKVDKLYIKDHLILNLDGKKHWFFHGDVFDNSVKTASWIAKLGGKGYDLLIRINRMINKISAFFGRPPKSFAKKIKSNVKKAVKFVGDFEQTAIDLAIKDGYHAVICGHIHQAKIKEYSNDKGKVVYMNSGDWVESLTALEYHNGQWSLYQHKIEQEQNITFKEASFSIVSNLRRTANAN